MNKTNYAWDSFSNANKAAHCLLSLYDLQTWSWYSVFLRGHGMDPYLGGRPVDAAAMEWAGAVHIDLVNIF